MVENVVEKKMPEKCVTCYFTLGDNPCKILSPACKLDADYQPIRWTKLYNVIKRQQKEG